MSRWHIGFLQLPEEKQKLPEMREEFIWFTSLHKSIIMYTSNLYVLY